MFGRRKTMTYAFKIAFWHTFGDHAREPAQAILVRKANEIRANGWTLWSFQYRRMLDDWLRHLTSVPQEKVLVFCSDPCGADPRQQVECRSHRLVGEREWRRLPEKVKVPHSFPSGQTKASAFVVQRVIHPVARFDRPSVEWLSREGEWCGGYQSGPRWCAGLPTRGEYLIRPGGSGRIRGVSAILELKAPYLAEVTAGPA
jgi:hypothetical protein